MIVPYLYFNGSASDAIALYVHAFQAETPQIERFGDMPADPGNPVPVEAANLVMHAELHLADGVVMISDAFGKMVGMDGNISLQVILDDGDALRHAFDVLKEGGEVGMPLAPTFWTPLFGSLTDRFGVEWQLGLAAKNPSSN